MKFISALAFSFMTFLFLALVPSGQAQAFDQQMVMREFQDFAQQNDVILTFESAEKTNASDLTIRNLDFYDDKTRLRRKVDTLVLINLDQSSGGAISYDAIDMQGLTVSGKPGGNDVSVIIDRLSMTGLKFADASSNASDPWPSQISRVEADTITLKSVENGVNSQVMFPNGKAVDVTRSGIRNFTAGLLELPAGKGEARNRKGEDIDINIGAIRIENTEFFGVSGLEVGSFDLAASLIQTTNQQGKPVEIRFEGMNFQNLYLPDVTLEDKPLLSDKDIVAEIKPLEITVGGEKFLTWERGYGKTTLDKSTNTVFSEGGLDQLMIDLPIIPRNARNAQSLDTLKDLDLEQPVLNVRGKGSWLRDDGIVNIDKYQIELENGAAFSLSARLSGYSEDIARRFSAVMAKTNAETNPQRRNAMSVQAIAVLAGLTVERVELSLEDRSLLDRVVNVQAAKLNREPEQLKGVVGPMVNIAMISLDAPEFSAQVSQALGSFMQGNKKLVVTAEPENGLVITEIIALVSSLRSGQLQPAEFIRLLNISVTTQ